jgi:hypothetical protein
MNVSDWLIRDDPRRALELGRVGVAKAIRVGYQEWAASLAGNATIASLLLGEWQQPGEWESLASPGLTVFSRFATMAVASLVRTYRTGTVSLADAGIVPEMRTSGSHQDHGAMDAMFAWEAYAADRMEAVMAHARAALAVYTGAEALAAGLLAGRAAFWLDDPTGVREVIARLHEQGDALGRWLDAGIAGLAAGAAWLEGGREEPVATLREALDVMRRLELQPEIAETILLLLRVGGASLADREELVAEARGIIDRLGALTIGRRLDRITTGVGARA